MALADLRKPLIQYVKTSFWNVLETKELYGEKNCGPESQVYLITLLYRGQLWVFCVFRVSCWCSSRMCTEPNFDFLFINQLTNYIIEKNRHRIQLIPGVMELFILSFADDVALLSTTSGLQNQLDCLKTSCDQMKREVNKDKTKTYGIQKGGILAKQEK